MVLAEQSGGYKRRIRIETIPWLSERKKQDSFPYISFRNPRKAATLTWLCPPTLLGGGQNPGPLPVSHSREKNPISHLPSLGGGVKKLFDFNGTETHTRLTAAVFCMTDPRLGVVQAAARNKTPMGEIGKLWNNWEDSDEAFCDHMRTQKNACGTHIYKVTKKPCLCRLIT